MISGFFIQNSLCQRKIDISVTIVYIFDAFDEHHDRRNKDEVYQYPRSAGEYGAYSQRS